MVKNADHVSNLEISNRSIPITLTENQLHTWERYTPKSNFESKMTAIVETIRTKSMIRNKKTHTKTKLSNHPGKMQTSKSIFMLNFKFMN
jgi:hypothetical protein